MPSPVIVAAARTPIGRAVRGSLAGERPEDLAIAAISAAMQQAPGLDPAEIEDIHLGVGVPGGMQGSNLARVVAVALGWDRTPGVTVSRFCASSLHAIRSAAQAIRSGEGTAFVAAGVESISSFRTTDVDRLPDARSPLFRAAGRHAERQAADEVPWTDPRAAGLLPDVYIAMGQTAENIARLHGIGRDEQDAYALRSQERTRDRASSGFWAEEITPYRTADGRLVTVDDSPRPSTSKEGLAGLQPVFRPGGSVTAGNSCPLNDGASALVIMSDERAEELGLTPLAEIIGSSTGAVSPEIMGMGPVPAIERLLARTGLTVDDFDEIEINEAFAVQVLANARALGIDPERLNVNGGSIALGHPYGMTGARIATTLIHSLRSHGGTLGLEAMCVAGGQGMAIALRRLT